MRTTGHLLLAAWILWASDVTNNRLVWKPVATFEPVSLELETVPAMVTPMVLCSVVMDAMSPQKSSLTQTTFQCLMEGQFPYATEEVR